MTHPDLHTGLRCATMTNTMTNTQRTASTISSYPSTRNSGNSPWVFSYPECRKISLSPSKGDVSPPMLLWGARRVAVYQDGRQDTRRRQAQFSMLGLRTVSQRNRQDVNAILECAGGYAPTPACSLGARALVFVLAPMYSLSGRVFLWINRGCHLTVFVSRRLMKPPASLHDHQSQTLKADANNRSTQTNAETHQIQQN